MTTGIKRSKLLRGTLLILLIMIGSAINFAAREEYDKASDKDIVKAQTVTAKFDQTTSDGYNYIYWLRFNAPQTKGQAPTVSIENPSLPTVECSIEKAAGSSLRKELWCKDKSGNDIRIILKYEEMPGARNATILKLYVDKYPGKRANQKSIDATEVRNIYDIKNEYSSGSVLISSENSLLKPVRKWKVAKYPAIFQWIDANIPGAR